MAVEKMLDGFTITHQKMTIQAKQTDCLTFLGSLPDNSVDLIVTDPAYSGMNSKLKLGHGRIVGRYRNKGTQNGKWFAEFEDSEANYRAFLSACQRVLKTDVGHIYIMFDSYSLLTLGGFVREQFDVKNLITWDKVHIGMGHYYRRQHEYIIFATNGNNRNLRHRAFPDVWRFKRLTRAKYATQKPVELFQTMIFASAQPGFVVCDPFMGSGSAAIAALKNECHFMGCDISEKALSLTEERVAHFIEHDVDLLQPKSASLATEKVFWQ